MKKFTLFLSLIAALSVLQSCDWSTKPQISITDQRRIMGETMASAAITQTMICMDPFNIAFRLNTLMTACEEAGLELTDVNDMAVYDVRSTLFGGVTINYDEDTKVFTIVFGSGGTNTDYARSGNLSIRTGGRLLKDGTAWTVNLMQPYKLTFDTSSDLEVEDLFHLTIGSASYYISAPEENKWRCMIDDFKTVDSDGGEEYASLWEGTFTVTQTEHPGDQSLAKIRTSPFTIAIESGEGVTTVSMPFDKFTVKTAEDKPLLINPICSRSLVIGGELNISFSEYITVYPTAYTLVTWDDEGDCGAEVSAYFHGPINGM